ncbi:hypothetical protein VB715_01690 [Crocosphaera sp. UHCC 0190]|uniref:hypothetical protein n=1 Tax=Crocosphaera sp. UHCC 0190 TaxID=3110246 RepID=UPI002B21B483|nr:hypothetical protein [Crocosphaera sp. UHCC 0190]MEA5508467.1 hypothetical protein [Crocosphaera sp. UHCC 0190]
MIIAKSAILVLRRRIGWDLWESHEGIKSILGFLLEVYFVEKFLPLLHQYLLKFEPESAGKGDNVVLVCQPLILTVEENQG